MAERVHPVSGPNPKPDGSLPPPPPPPRDYIIQVPKDQVYRVPPPENQRRFERYTRHGKRGRGCCRSCCCWFFLSLLLLVLAAGISAAVLYLTFRPKAPSYSVDSLSIRGLDLNSTAAISPQIDAVVRAENPNRRIGLRYGDGSSVDVNYGDVRLCGGSWPAFEQWGRNVTIVRMELRGDGVRLAESSRKALAAAEGKGRVPLEVDVKVPVRVRVGELRLWKMDAKVRCHVVVDRLSPVATVVEKSCSVKIDVF